MSRQDRCQMVRNMQHAGCFKKSFRNILFHKLPKKCNLKAERLIGVILHRYKLFFPESMRYQTQRTGQMFEHTLELLIKASRRPPSKRNIGCCHCSRLSIRTCWQALLRMLHPLVTGHGKVMLVPIQKLPPFWIALMVLERATKAARRDIVNRFPQL